MGIKLRPLQLGWLGRDHELAVFPHPDLILNVNRRSGKKRWLRCSVLSYVIEHPDGLLLWDTGVSAKWPTEWLTAWQHLTDLSEVTPEVCLLSRVGAPKSLHVMRPADTRERARRGGRVVRSCGFRLVRGG